MRTIGAQRYLGWAAFAALGALSLWPGGLQVRTGAGSHLEHFVAYAFTGFFLALGHPGFNARFATWCLLGMYAAALERLQLVIPGHTSQVVDVEGGVAGAFAGLLGALLFELIAYRSRR
ncbi:hypothetical protein [Salinarimonas soli]|uniref:VanZ family protein n=1 Tax=Salinarimonas soli TaxID=1638099 RepID=A0A5B2VDJ5_9HYPH|nr:hypothetical protein [Salinarimonas soli]KAA2236482.1 hypothetical protein F0L46_15190 [Salinarimonas soli]